MAWRAGLWPAGRLLHTPGVKFRVLIGQLDVRYTGYYRRGLRIRFHMIVYRLFYSCTVKGYNTGPQQWWDWRGFKGANLPPDKMIAKTEPQFCLYLGIQFFFGFQLVVVFLHYSEVFGLLFPVISSFSV